MYNLGGLPVENIQISNYTYPLYKLLILAHLYVGRLSDIHLGRFAIELVNFHIIYLCPRSSYSKFPDGMKSSITEKQAVLKPDFWKYLRV